MAVLDSEVARRARAAAEVLAREGVVRAAYVFGSQVDGRADASSDIDVAAFMDDVASWDIWRRTRVIVSVQKQVGYDIEPHLFPASALHDPEAGSFAADILHHGIRIL